METASGPVGLFGGTVEHALGRDRRAARLHPRGPQQERGGRLLTEQADRAMRLGDEVHVLLHCRRLGGELERHAGHTHVDVVGRASVLPVPLGERGRVLVRVGGPRLRREAHLL